MISLSDFHSIQERYHLSLVIDDKYHLIRCYDYHYDKNGRWNTTTGSGVHKTAHSIFDEKTGILRTKWVNNFNQIYEQGTLIHLNKRNELLLSRGMENVRIYSMDTRKWSDTFAINVGRKSRNGGKNVNQWTVVGDRDFNGCLSENGKYLVTFAGDERIHIIDVSQGNRFKSIKSRISTPSYCPSPYCSLLSLEKSDVSVNGVCIYGYFRACWIDIDAPILSVDIVHIIGNMMKSEAFIHVFSKKNSSHFKIKLKYILQ